MTEHKILGHDLSSKQRTNDVILSEDVSFASLILPPEILKGLSACGFEKPSPVQVKALPVGRCGFDLMVKSKSGTGKTLVFGIISLESVRLQKLEPQVLILAPTREIAVQIQEVIKNIGKYFEGLFVECFIGGLSVAIDKTKCKACHIAVGTPGRIKQLIHDASLKVDSIKIFVLDEADKLTEDSFQNDINEIYNSLPDRKQIIMCSATYPDEMQDFLGQYMRSPVMVDVELETPLLLGLKQYVRLLKPPLNVVQQMKAKNEELLRTLSSVSFVQCLVFSNYQIRAESISNYLNGQGWHAIFMSGAQKQTERLDSLSNLKEFKCKILVTTDLAARGIDAPNVDLVINYDVPVDAMTYLHRMGRAGRYGSTGNCINLTFLGEESKLLRNILGLIGGQSLSIPILDGSFNLDHITDDYFFANAVGSVKDFNSYSKEIGQIRTSLAENNKKAIKKKLNCSKDVKDRDALNNIIEENSNKDISSILEELASGSFEMSTNSNKVNLKTELHVALPNKPENKSNPDPSLLLQQLADDGEVLNVSMANHKEEDTFCRNKALCSVAKMLSNVEVSHDDCNDLTTYFSTLKAQEKLELHVDRSALITDYSELLENIFSFAYKSQISKDARKWQNLLSEEDKEKVKDDYFNAAVEGASDLLEDDCYDEDYDFEIEKNIEVKYTDNSNDYSFMEWVPVEPQKKLSKISTIKEPPYSAVAKKPKPDDTVYCDPCRGVANENQSYHAQYNRYFQHCGSNLWQNGLTFDSVDNFDRWFLNDWERQLDSVRDFVQKNVYMQEMSNFY